MPKYFCRSLWEFAGMCDTIARQIFPQLVECLYFPDDYYFKKWVTKVYTAIEELDVIKQTELIPSAPFIYHSFVDNRLPQVMDWAEDIMRKHKCILTVDEEKLRLFMCDLFSWIAGELVKEEQIDSQVFLDYVTNMCANTGTKYKPLPLPDPPPTPPVLDDTILEKFDLRYFDIVCDAHPQHSVSNFRIQYPQYWVHTFDGVNWHGRIRIVTGYELPEYCKTHGEHTWSRFQNFDVLVKFNNETKTWSLDQPTLPPPVLHVK